MWGSILDVRSATMKKVCKVPAFIVITFQLTFLHNACITMLSKQVLGMGMKQMINQHHCKRKSVLQLIFLGKYFFLEIGLVQGTRVISYFQDLNDNIYWPSKLQKCKRKQLYGGYFIGIWKWVHIWEHFPYVSC